MKKWLLLLVFLLLAAFILIRERYTNYEEALKDVGQTAGYITPQCESGYTMDSEQSECSKPKPDGTKETKPPTCPSGSSFVKRGSRGVCEPLPAAPAAAETTTSTPDSVSTPETASTPASVTGSTPAVSVPASVPPPAATGTTTGGSSTSTRGSTATTGSGKGVWGPAFPGLGENGNAIGGDSTKTTPYPTLMGGMMGKQSTRIEGVGIVPPSTPGLGLPSAESMGSDPNSGYLPYSRQPGDMDLIPDPYRLSKSYSASNYSSKRSEPVPFLTDFSAFMK